MKRSEINSVMRKALALFEEYRVSLPPFVLWTPEEWKEKGEECSEIVDNMLGWDITDFGSGDFSKMGLFLITTRNGNQKMPEKYPKVYAEKLMIVEENQVTPMHFHWFKTEDIINRGGGNLMIKLYKADENEGLSDEDIEIVMDGVKKTFPAGTVVRLTPGESITFTKGIYHRFWGEEGHGTVMVGEVSMCNDDANDNRFYDEVGRFPAIEEDEAPLYYLCNEYPALKK